MPPRALAMALVVSAMFGVQTDAALTVEVLRSVGGLPPHIVGLFEEPLGFQQTPGGPYYVFDRRGHTVYSVDADRKSALKLIEIGQELGRIIQPAGSIPPRQDRLSSPTHLEASSACRFRAGGIRVGGFTLPVRQTTAEITLGPSSSTASRRSSAERTCSSASPKAGPLRELSIGFALRSIGRLRDTGHEQDRDLHLALNVGLPIADRPAAFLRLLAGRPMFRMTATAGCCSSAMSRASSWTIISRRCRRAGRRGGARIASCRWCRRRSEQPRSIQRTALISLSQPYTYVYDMHGDKVRTVQFSAAGTISRTACSHPRRPAARDAGVLRVQTLTTRPRGTRRARC
jgi:hypothetical protein